MAGPFTIELNYDELEEMFFNYSYVKVAHLEPLPMQETRATIRGHADQFVNDMRLAGQVDPEVLSEDFTEKHFPKRLFPEDD